MTSVPATPHSGIRLPKSLIKHVAAKLRVSRRAHADTIAAMDANERFVEGTRVHALGVASQPRLAVFRQCRTSLSICDVLPLYPMRNGDAQSQPQCTNAKTACLTGCWGPLIRDRTEAERRQRQHLPTESSPTDAERLTRLRGSCMAQCNKAEVSHSGTRSLTARLVGVKTEAWLEGVGQYRRGILALQDMPRPP